LFKVYGEGAANDVFERSAVVVTLFVVEDVLQGFRGFRLPLSHIVVIGLDIKQDLIARRHDWHVDEHIIVEGDAHEDADQLEIDVWLEGASVEPIHFRVLVVLEHRKFGVEKLFDYQVKVLFSNAADVNAGFIRELNFQRKL